jgi:hypothetical protein
MEEKKRGMEYGRRRKKKNRVYYISIYVCKNNRGNKNDDQINKIENISL